MSTIEAKARRAAEEAGWIAYKSGWRAGTSHNLGGFRVFDPQVNGTIHGTCFDLSAEQVIELCGSRG